MDLKKDLPIRTSEMGVLNITAHITSLLEKEYIQKEQSLDDKRVFYIFPTKKVFQLVEKSKVGLSESLEKLIQEIGENEFDYFVSIAEKANNIFAKEREKNK